MILPRRSGPERWPLTAAKERPRGFLPLDVDYLSQDSIRELGQEFGPAGPLLLVAIIAEAQRYAIGGAPVSKQGTVQMRYRSAAISAFLPGPDAEGMARAIIDRCIALGLLERLLSDDDAGRFHVRLLKWAKWHPKDATAADRKRRSREDQAQDAEALDW